MDHARKAIGKRLRFSIFERDQFTCQYCGKTPPKVVLHVDHIIPVVAGGTNDPENLRTSCADCNLGKGKRKLHAKVLNPIDAMRRMQEAAEDIKTAEAFAEALKARELTRQNVTNHICELLLRDNCKRSSVTVATDAIADFGVNNVLRWLDYAASRILNDFRNGPMKEDSMMRYFSAIVRNHRNGDE